MGLFGVRRSGGTLKAGSTLKAGTLKGTVRRGLALRRAPVNVGWHPDGTMVAGCEVPHCCDKGDETS